MSSNQRSVLYGDNDSLAEVDEFVDALLKVCQDYNMSFYIESDEHAELVITYGTWHGELLRDAPVDRAMLLRVPHRVPAAPEKVEVPSEAPRAPGKDQS